MRILHTMLRVTDLEVSKKFYTEILGMTLLREKEMPHGEFTLAFLGYGDESDNAVLELTYNWGVDNYEMGNAYGHIALEVEDIYATVERLEAQGYKASRPPGPMKGSDTVLTFIKDPDGYPIELIHQKISY